MKIKVETTANAFGSTFAFLPTHKANAKNAKELPSQRTTTRQKETTKQDPKKGDRLIE